MRIVAFDLSLTATGVASDDGVEVLTPPESCSRGIARLRWLRGAILDRAGDVNVLEGYSFASKGRAIISLGELGGVVRVALTDAGVQWVDVPPTCRAKYATGKGNASKESVFAEAIRRLGYAGCSNDEADALWLRAMALDHYGAPLCEMPKAQRAALETIRWPGAIAHIGPVSDLIQTRLRGSAGNTRHRRLVGRHCDPRPHAAAVIN